MTRHLNHSRNSSLPESRCKICQKSKTKEQRFPHSRTNLVKEKSNDKPTFDASEYRTPCYSKREAIYHDCNHPRKTAAGCCEMPTFPSQEEHDMLRPEWDSGQCSCPQTKMDCGQNGGLLLDSGFSPKSKSHNPCDCKYNSNPVEQPCRSLYGDPLSENSRERYKMQMQKMGILSYCPKKSSLDGSGASRQNRCSDCTPNETIKEEHTPSSNLHQCSSPSGAQCPRPKLTSKFHTCELENNCSPPPSVDSQLDYLRSKNRRKSCPCSQRDREYAAHVDDIPCNLLSRFQSPRPCSNFAQRSGRDRMPAGYGNAGEELSRDKSFSRPLTEYVSPKMLRDYELPTSIARSKCDLTTKQGEHSWDKQASEENYFLNRKYDDARNVTDYSSYLRGRTKAKDFSLNVDSKSNSWNEWPRTESKDTRKRHSDSGVSFVKGREKLHDCALLRHRRSLKWDPSCRDHFPSRYDADGGYGTTKERMLAGADSIRCDSFGENEAFIIARHGEDVRCHKFRNEESEPENSQRNMESTTQTDDEMSSNVLEKLELLKCMQELLFRLLELMRNDACKLRSTETSSGHEINGEPQDSDARAHRHKSCSSSIENKAFQVRSSLSNNREKDDCKRVFESPFKVAAQSLRLELESVAAHIVNEEHSKASYELCDEMDRNDDSSVPSLDLNQTNLTNGSSGDEESYKNFINSLKIPSSHCFRSDSHNKATKELAVRQFIRDCMSFSRQYATYSQTSLSPDATCISEHLERCAYLIFHTLDEFLDNRSSSCDGPISAQLHSMLLQDRPERPTPNRGMRQLFPIGRRHISNLKKTKNLISRKHGAVRDHDGAVCSNGRHSRSLKRLVTNKKSSRHHRKDSHCKSCSGSTCESPFRAGCDSFPNKQMEANESSSSGQDTKDSTTTFIHSEDRSRNLALHYSSGRNNEVSKIKKSIIKREPVSQNTNSRFSPHGLRKSSHKRPKIWHSCQTLKKRVTFKDDSTHKVPLREIDESFILPSHLPLFPESANKRVEQMILDAKRALKSSV